VSNKPSRSTRADEGRSENGTKTDKHPRDLPPEVHTKTSYGWEHSMYRHRGVWVGTWRGFNRLRTRDITFRLGEGRFVTRKMK